VKKQEADLQRPGIKQQQPFYNQVYNILRIPTRMGVTWRGVKKEQPTIANHREIWSPNGVIRTGGTMSK